MSELNLVDFLEPYLESKFVDGRISGHNFMTNCIFCNDHKRKLGINLVNGIYHCFICGERGEFVNLYAKLENISKFQAHIKLNYKTFLAPPKPKEYGHLVAKLSVEEEVAKFLPLTLDSHSSDNALIRKAWCYLYSRSLFDLSQPENNTFYVCMEGKFADRLIIPYTYKGHIVYFQGRSLVEGLKPKYLNLDSSHGVRSSDILYPFQQKLREVILCEGPIDARSLQLQGVNATCTTGCYTSENQLSILKSWGGKIIAGYDNDTAGLKGIRDLDRLRRKKNMPPIYVCHPPKEHKDWNAAHMAGVNLNKWVAENTVEYGFESKIKESLGNLEVQ